MAQEQNIPGGGVAPAEGGGRRQGADSNFATQAHSGEGASACRFKEEIIDWEQLKSMGLAREYLQRSGMLDTMLRGYQTDPQRITLDLPGTKGSISARMSFRGESDRTVLNLEGVQQTPDLTKPYLGHLFSTEDRKNLLGPTGNMGRVVELTCGREKIPCFISRDTRTNVIKHMKLESLKLPADYKGQVFDSEQRETLRRGEPILVENMTAKSGREYDATLQVSAERRGWASTSTIRSSPMARSSAACR
ncbi:hypothetical protein FACS1894159_06790 [Bacteroidia bacterium]|nr:hypothetical protein FACS1894159_06790 [Bacteroidia bacterium]